MKHLLNWTEHLNANTKAHHSLLSKIHMYKKALHGNQTFFF